MNGVDDEDGIVAAIDEVQNGFSGMAAPYLDVRFQREKHIRKQSLMDVRPFEFGYSEGRSCGTWTKHGPR